MIDSDKDISIIEKEIIFSDYITKSCRSVENEWEIVFP